MPSSGSPSPRGMGWPEALVMGSASSGVSPWHPDPCTEWAFSASSSRSPSWLWRAAVLTDDSLLPDLRQEPPSDISKR